MQSTFFLSFAVKYSKMESYELVKAQICNNGSLQMDPDGYIWNFQRSFVHN